ncbi:MAG: Stk1 family PASTA domain-containing Ser/Thr kinase [Clostridiaceae bacterium]|nr:Stk1 family PASTA domain-containing Ser/Thr kinase [Clostridiaceae bacterium]
MDKFIGKMLDNRYELLEVIGVGGMAVVYKAKCHRLNRYVAVKILKDEYAADEDFRRQFHDESQAVAMLSHPNIVNVYDVSRSGNIEYIVMELIDGITLKDYLSRRGPLTPKEIIIFSTQIAKALEHAHSRDIIHRDIKPQNIMLLRDGTVKVADFGIARLMNRQQTYSKGEAIGSVHYVSPEQAKGSHIDNRTDIYSLGVIMYEMITGRLPFEGDTPVSIALQHINSLALPPSALMDGVPPQLEDITMKAMNPSLSKRYASATQMLEDLEAFRADLQVQVEIPSAQMKPVPDEMPAQAEENLLDATRKLQNTGEVQESSYENGQRKGEKPGDLPQEIKKGGTPTAGKRSGIFGSSMIFSIIAVLVFVIGAVYFMISVINPFGNPTNDKLTVPQLVGSMYDTVAASMTDFQLVLGDQVYNETVPVGQIISQDPTSGRTADPGDTITVTVSRGPKSTVLSDYVGQEARLVKNELDRMGISVIENEEYDDEIASACIISTSPEAGSTLEAGATVVLTVSKGKEPVPVVVPNLVDMMEEAARALLTERGLICGQAVYIESDKEAGKVTFQTIPADSTVDSGTIVDIYVSKGSAAQPSTGDSTGSGTGSGNTGSDETGGGTSYDPYPDDPSKRTISYTFSLTDDDGPISVEVLVNGKTEYLGTHYTKENNGEVTVQLTGYAGYNTVKVLQNQTATSEEYLYFE